MQYVDKFDWFLCTDISKDTFKPASSLIYNSIFFQAPGEARTLLKFFDGSLGVPIEEQDYGGGCLIYDPDVPDNP